MKRYKIVEKKYARYFRNFLEIETLRGDMYIYMSKCRSTSQRINLRLVKADTNSGCARLNRVNPVGASVHPTVEDHPKGIRRVERDDDRWEAAMGGIAGIIVTQFASPRRRRPRSPYIREVREIGSPPGTSADGKRIDGCAN